MAKATGYYAKAISEGVWAVYDDKGALVEAVGCGFSRAKARRFAFRLNVGELKIDRRRQQYSKEHKRKVA